MTTTDDRKLKVVGTSPIRHDGVDKVTGRAVYGGDFYLPGMLYGKVLRSPHAHAKIKSIDYSEALKLHGVRAIVTAKDLPGVDNDILREGGEGGIWALKDVRGNVLAGAKALYRGQSVAAVAADSLAIAEDALELIKVEYEPLPSVLKVRDAMKSGAPILHDDLFTNELGKAADKPSNIASHQQFKQGDVEAAFKKADVIIEREFETASVHQGYIEPHNSTSRWEPDGRLTIWCSTQGSFVVRDQISQLFQMPLAKVRVVPMEIGGGFGGKVPIYLESLTTLLSKQTGRPVKIVMKRDEEFEATGPNNGSYIRCKIGATNQGRMVAIQGTLHYEAGAFKGSPVAAGMRGLVAAYDIENLLIDGYDVVVNKPKTQAYRAPGATPASMASETMVDELAEKLGIDPLKFRLMNAAKEGTRRPDGVLNPRIGMEESVVAALESDHYNSPLGGPNRGRGVATGYWGTGGGQSSVNLNVNPDGTVIMVEGSVDIGGSRTVLAMQVAEALGIAAEDIRPMVVDTDAIGYTGVTGGSRTTFATGMAAYEAAQDLKGKLIERTSQMWEVSPEQVDYRDGVLYNKADPALAMTFKELAARLNSSGGPISGTASVSARSKIGSSYTTQLVDLEVDPETGGVKILRVTVIQDAGKAVHRGYAEGQLQGGIVQGLGWALNEEYAYNDDGRMTNPTLLDYRMPLALDLPMIDPIIVEVANPDHPYGVRGIGEPPIVPTAAAVANAIYRATGIRMNKLPMNPARILEAIQAKDRESSV
jgi:xanthine dehydrogenase molybdenum-binding subunit